MAHYLTNNVTGFGVLLELYVFLTSQEAKDRSVTVTWWKQVYVKQAHWLEVTVLRVVRPHETNKERDPRVRFVWVGDVLASLPSIDFGYVRRFDKSMAIALINKHCCG